MGPYKKSLNPPPLNLSPNVQIAVLGPYLLHKLARKLCKKNYEKINVKNNVETCKKPFLACLHK